MAEVLSTTCYSKRVGKALAVVFVTLSVISGLGLLEKSQLLHCVLHLPVPMLSILVPLALCLPLAWKFALKYRYGFASLFLIGLVAGSIIVYPKITGLHSI